MPNTFLTATAVTREALRVLHQKLNFVGSIDRQYDDRFAQEGAKIGSQLKIRKPNQYVVRTGKTLVAQETQEESITLTVDTQKGVDMNFSSVDLTMSLDDFSERIIEPAMSVLAANIEADALSMYKAVYNEVADIGQGLDYPNVMLGRKLLQDNLAPSDHRTALLNTQDQINVIDDVKALFNQQGEIGKQFKEGYIGRAVGFDFAENTLLPIHLTGSDDGTGDYLTNDNVTVGGQTGATLVVDTGTGTLKKGDIITIGGVFRVHPETKTSTGILQQFVVTADVGANATSLPIAPAIVASGARQNVSNGAADGQAITKLGGANTDHGISLLYHRDAFTFATADLIMPKGVDFGSRQTLDGISMRIVRAYDINNDNLPCRLDVLYGYVAQRPEWAARLAFN